MSIANVSVGERVDVPMRVKGGRGWIPGTVEELVRVGTRHPGYIAVVQLDDGRTVHTPIGLLVPERSR